MMIMMRIIGSGSVIGLIMFDLGSVETASVDRRRVTLS
jgi:hypothetical protein